MTQAEKISDANKRLSKMREQIKTATGKDKMIFAQMIPAFEKVIIMMESEL